MIVTLLVISLIISITSLVAFFVVMKVLFDQNKQQVAVNKRCKKMESDFKPIRLNYIVQSYNLCIKNEEFECAGKILNIIKGEFPEEYKRMGFKA